MTQKTESDTEIVDHILTVDPTPQRGQRAWTVLVFLLPTAVFFALGVRAVEISNGQDGYLYVGAAARISDFLQRFPDAYYGMRFGYLIPQVVFNRFFGVEIGYLALRLMLIGLICVVLRMKGLIEPPAAVLATVMVSTSPIVLVAAFNTYTLSIGVLTFVAGSVLLATHRETGRIGVVRVGSAGALLALSWNSHFVALPPSLLVGGVFLADQFLATRANERRRIVHYGLSLVVGTLLVVFSAVAVYGIRFNIWNVYEPTLAQSRKPTDNYYLETGWRWISWRTYLLVAPFSLIAVFCAWRTERDEYLRAALRRFALFSSLTFILFAVFQWLQDDPLLATYFYSALPLALCTVTLAFAASVVVQRCPSHVLLPVAVALCIAVVVASVLGSRFGGSFASVAVVGIAACGATLVGARRHDWLLPAGTAAIVVVATWAAVSAPHDFPSTPGGFRTDPFYDDVLFAYDRNSLDQVKVIDEFARTLPSLPDERGELRVWFDPGSSLEQLSAPFVWYRSALQAPGDGTMPRASPTVRTGLIDGRPRFVVVVNADEDSALRGATAVSRLAPYSVVSQRSIRHGDTTAHVVLLERAAGTWLDYPCDAPRMLAPVACTAE